MTATPRSLTTNRGRDVEVAAVYATGLASSRDRRPCGTTSGRTTFVVDAFRVTYLRASPHAGRCRA